MRIHRSQTRWSHDFEETIGQFGQFSVQFLLIEKVFASYDDHVPGQEKCSSDVPLKLVLSKLFVDYQKSSIREG